MDPETNQPFDGPELTPRRGMEMTFKEGMYHLGRNDLIGPLIVGWNKNAARYWKPKEEMIATYRLFRRRQYRDEEVKNLVETSKVPVKVATCLAVSVLPPVF